MKLHVTCICGRRTGEMGCAEVERAYQKNLALKVAEEMSILGTFSSEHRVLQRSPSMDKYKCLPCDMECRRIMRNKKVANALNIATDADSNALDAEGQPIRTAPLYSDYLKKQVKTNARLVQEVEDALVELVQNVQMQASSTTQVHTFRPMSSDSRRFIHEYATYFRVETISYDAEPKRNVVATAKSGVSLIPFVLLTVAHGTCREKRSTAYRLCEAELESETSSSVPSLQKNYSWDTESGMQQLTSVANVVKRQTIDTESLAADR
ncbi:hypothetical protein AB6A40_000026 [Gnathostoma spinigerum]|uniref:R3H domain-containing protein n=1 Tax=Gnathostoma spinigerum TaxID=75299 RepID=A0ABD6E3A5_9BILA